MYFCRRASKAEFVLSAKKDVELSASIVSVVLAYVAMNGRSALS